MKVEVVKVGSFQTKLQFSVPVDSVRKELDRAYRQLGGRVRLRGFRPGKAPRKVLEARFGGEVTNDVAMTLIQRSYSQAVTEHELQPVGRPEVERGELSGKDDFEFTITVDVRPEVELEQYTGVDVVYPPVLVAPEEIDHEVSRRLEAETKLVAVEDRPVAEGDFALISLTAKGEGDEAAVDEPGTMLRTAGDPYYPGLEEHVVGMAIGDDKTVSVTFAEDAKAEAVAGGTFEVQVTVQQIQANETPELTDDLAEKLGFEGGIEAMRASIDMDIRKGRDEMARNQARANLLQALIERNPFEVPDGLVDEQLEMLVQELKLQQSYRGRDPRQIHFDEAQMADLRVRSVFACKGGLILEHVSKTEKIEVTDADLEGKFSELADERGMTVEAVRGYFVQDDAIETLRARLLEERTLEWLLERANFVDPPSPVADEEADAPEEAGEAAAAEADAEPEAPAEEAGEAEAAEDSADAEEAAEE